MLSLGDLSSQVTLVTSPEAMGSWLVLQSTPGCLFRSIAAAILLGLLQPCVETAPSPGARRASLLIPPSLNPFPAFVQVLSSLPGRSLRVGTAGRSLLRDHFLGNNGNTPDAPELGSVKEINDRSEVKE